MLIKWVKESVNACVMHVGIANPRWREKRSRHSWRMRNPQIYVSGKRPIVCSVYIHMFRESPKPQHQHSSLEIYNIFDICETSCMKFKSANIQTNIERLYEWRTCKSKTEVAGVYFNSKNNFIDIVVESNYVIPFFGKENLKILILTMKFIWWPSQ